MTFLLPIFSLLQMLTSGLPIILLRPSVHTQGYRARYITMFVVACIWALGTWWFHGVAWQMLLTQLAILAISANSLDKAPFSHYRKLDWFLVVCGFCAVVIILLS